MGTITERQRQRLRQWADRHMDEETADIFMASTPPTGWDDIPTRSDLQLLAADFRAALAEEIGSVRAELNRHTVALIVAIIAVFGAQTVAPYWFPPPTPQIEIRAPGD